MAAVVTPSGGGKESGDLSIAGSVASWSRESESSCIAQKEPSEPCGGGVKSSEEKEGPLVLALGAEGVLETEEPTLGELHRKLDHTDHSP